MRNVCVSCLAFLWMATVTLAQVGINTDNGAPDNSAMLDVKSTTKGFLPPRVTQQQMSQIANPADGLMVYCTTDSKIYVFMASLGQWKEVSLGTGTVNPPFTCGMNLTVNHTINAVAPANKTVTYGTVSGIPGETDKCWITRNLGASGQATAVDDATELAAGWLWQFNRKQGYKAEGYSLTPSWTIYYIDENSGWQTDNDPCRLELGAQWRIPAKTEWSNVNLAGGWANWNGPWSSALKLHAAGFISSGPNGYLINRGLFGSYWSSTQDQNIDSWLLGIHNEGSEVISINKATGSSVRCLMESCSSYSSVGVSINPSSNPFCQGNQVTFTATPVNGGSAPVYQWRVNGINLETSTSTISYYPNTNDSVCCIMTSNQNCVNNNTATSNMIIMMANPLAPVSVTIAPSANPVCAGSQVTLTANPTNGGTSPAYQWKKGGNNISGATNPTYTFSPANGDAITCVLTSNAVCNTGSPATSNVITMLTSLLINHVTTGGVAPVNKSTTYGTVTNIPGETTKCWITSNLGSSHQATAWNDTTEASAGWYWQFNRKQGYKHNGSTLTPSWTTTSIIEYLNWQAVNDPCRLELGPQWRLPTDTEWSNVDNAGGWTYYGGPWNSNLKLHAAGALNYSNGSLFGRGSVGDYWSSIVWTMTNSKYLHFDSYFSAVWDVDKAYGHSIRCLRDN